MPANKEEDSAVADSAARAAAVVEASVVVAGEAVR